LSALQGDAALYAASALFALGLGLASHEPAQWHWGYLAIAAYALGSFAAWLFSRSHPRRESAVRIGLLALVIAGAMALPLGLEVRWRQLDHGQSFAQPEVSVIERAADSVSKGHDPYRSYMWHGHVVNAVKGLPTYESFFPYFPLMSVFGLPSAETHKSHGLTDARVVMSLMTLLVGGLALALLRATRRQKIRVAQVLWALPTGALFLATGGDDMPIIALSLLGVAALQRRSTALAGVSFGLAAAMKLTAWPLAAGALLVAYAGEGRRSWRSLAVIVGTIVTISIAPFALHNPGAFISNVVAFPLGFAGVSSPAASALPGHVLSTMWSPLGHLLAPVTMLVGGYFLMRYLHRHWPVSLSTLLGLLAVSFAVLICAASSTRIGYVIYPINLALWSRVCAPAPAPAPVLELV
jgi:hypothetical protein